MAGGNKQMYAKLKGNILSFPVKISTAIFRGTAVAIDSAGYLVQIDDDAAMKFVGFSEEACTVAQAVADGTISIRVRRHGIIRMTKNTTSAVTDVGKLVYAHTEHTSSVDALVGLSGATTYDNIVGLVVRREPDTPGGEDYDNDWLMVDITPAPWSAADITTHAALADQTAHNAAAISPVMDTETVTNPTITSSEFIGGLVSCTYAGVVTPTLPSSGPDAGTMCRFVKAHGTKGALTIGAGTLVGPQCASNDFIGCPNNGDSVLIQCVGANSYRVVSVQQAIVPVAISGDATASAAEWLSGVINCSKGSAQAISLPGSGVPIGSTCILINTGSAHPRTISASALVGGAASANAHATMDAVGDSIIILCNGADDYTVIAESIA